jgi:hypothetical protein
LIICADDDAGAEGNPGQTKAREAARGVGGKVAVADFGADRPRGATDFNDLMLLRGAEAVKTQIAVAIDADNIDRSTTATDKKKRESQADILIKIVRESGAELFHTPTAETFISFPVNDHSETWPTNSQATRQWLRREFYLITQKAPNAEASQSTIGLLDSLGRFDGKTPAVHLRTAWHDGTLYYDLCDSAWRTVRIDRNGWQIVSDAEVKFIRYSHMAAQVEPQAGGHLDRLFEFVNIEERHARELTKSFLPVALIPDIPRPCLALHGDQGSGKTSTARRLRSLIDPSDMAMLRCKDDAETVQGLAHHYAPIIDNLSNLPEWLSDTLSRAVTGEGFTKRALYTNADDYLFRYKRVFILTGISPIERIEGELKPRQLRATIQGFLAESSLAGTFAPASLNADDPRLQQGVDDNGGAIVSRWWSVWFFEGTKEQQEARLEELRLDPQLQKPWSEGDIPVRLEGGAGCEDAYHRIVEERRNQKLTSA